MSSLQSFLTKHKERIQSWHKNPRFLRWKRNTKEDRASRAAIQKDFFETLFPRYQYRPRHGERAYLKDLVDNNLVSSYDRCDACMSLVTGDHDIWYIRTSNRHRNKNGTYYVTNNHCFVSHISLDQEIQHTIRIKQPFRKTSHLVRRTLWIFFLIVMLINMVWWRTEWFFVYRLENIAFARGIDIWWFLAAVSLVVLYLIYRRQHRMVHQNAIMLDHPRFEKIFDTICEDQIYARQILDADTMEDLLQAIAWDEKRYTLTFDHKRISIVYHISWSHVLIPGSKPSSVTQRRLVQAYRLLDLVSNMRQIADM